MPPRKVTVSPPSETADDIPIFTFTIDEEPPKSSLMGSASKKSDSPAGPSDGPIVSVTDESGTETTPAPAKVNFMSTLQYAPVGKSMTGLPIKAEDAFRSQASGIDFSMARSVERVSSFASFNPQDQSIMSMIRVPSNFGSQAHLFDTKGNQKKYPSIAFRKKAVYLHMTVIFGLALMGLLIYDFIDMNLYQTFTINQEWFTLVLSLHVIVLYINLLSFVYANESGDYVKYQIAVLFLFLNFGSFWCRIGFEFAYADYLPEVYVNYVQIQ